MGGGSFNRPVGEGEDDEEVDEMIGRTDIGGMGVTPPATPPTGYAGRTGPQHEAEKANRVCAWCKKELGFNPDIPKGEISHGMCEPCFQKQIDQIKKKVHEATGARRHLCKAVFMAGGPASGKTTVANRLFKIHHTSDKLPTSDDGWRIVNTDDMFKLLAHRPELQAQIADLEDLPKRVYALKGKDMEIAQDTLFPAARDLMKKLGNSFVAQRAPVVIDGTGRHYKSIAELKERLEELGYDCTMILCQVDLELSLQRNRDRERTVPEKFVRKAHAQVAGNVEKFRKLFGGRFYEIASGATDGAESIKGLGKTILDEPLENEKGKEWLVLNKLVREQANAQISEAERDYAKEYKDYHSRPDQRKNRSMRNQARRKMKMEVGDGLEVDHSKPLSKGGTNHGNNLKAMSRAANRKKGSKR
jgi:predicted kinase